jgi:hypothetical protein
MLLFVIIRFQAVAIAVQVVRQHRNLAVGKKFVIKCTALFQAVLVCQGAEFDFVIIVFVSHFDFLLDSRAFLAAA